VVLLGDWGIPRRRGRRRSAEEDAGSDPRNPEAVPARILRCGPAGSFGSGLRLGEDPNSMIRGRSSPSLAGAAQRARGELHPKSVTVQSLGRR